MSTLRCQKQWSLAPGFLHISQSTSCQQYGSTVKMSKIRCLVQRGTTKPEKKNNINTVNV